MTPYSREGDRSQTPKCHRKFLTGFAATERDKLGMSEAMADKKYGMWFSDMKAVRKEIERSVANLDYDVVIVTAGHRFPEMPKMSDNKKITLDCSNISDPDHKPELRGHVGYHKEILAEIKKVRQFEDFLTTGVAEMRAHTGSEPLVIQTSCKSGRHRSVAQDGR